MNSRDTQRTPENYLEMAAATGQSKMRLKYLVGLNSYKLEDSLAFSISAGFEATQSWQIALRGRPKQI